MRSTKKPAAVRATDGRSRTADGQETSERIVAVARTLFLRNGFDGTPMSHVAKAADVSTPAVYWHFESKDALYFEVIARGYQDFLDELFSRTVGKSPAARLHSYVRAFIDLQLRDTDVAMQYGFHQLRAGLSNEKQLEIDVALRENLTFLKEILRDGNADGSFSVQDLTVTALAIITMCEYVFTWFKGSARLTVNETADVYADLVGRLAGWQATGHEDRLSQRETIV